MFQFRKPMPILLTVFPVCLLAFMVRAPHTNPPVDASRSIEAVLQPPPEVAGTLRRACGDCHSNQTKWPWYSQVEPLASMLSEDVEKGRRALNFSEWRNDKRGAAVLLAACEAVESGRMPKSGYRAMHSDATPSAQEVRTLCAWTQKTGLQLLTSSSTKHKRTEGQ